MKVSELKKLNDEINKVYSFIYDYDLELPLENGEYVENGEKMLRTKKYKEIIYDLIQYRNDYFTSDRELIALYIVLNKHKNEF